MRKVILTAVTMLIVVAAFAIPARPGQWKELMLCNGTRVQAELCGDEFIKFWKTADGQCYVQQAGTECYQPADMAELRRAAAAMRQLDKDCRSSKTRAFGDGTQYIGKKKGLIILAQFSDLKFQSDHDNAFYQRVANEAKFTDFGYKGSVRDYFYDQSNGLFELNFDIAGPYTLSNSYIFYGQNDEKGNDKHPGKMVAEAVEKAAVDFDFTQYDWDGDHEVDLVFVVYAGQGEASGGSDDTIWPHKWSLEYATGSPMSINNMHVNTYACGSELGSSERTTSGIGTICHEFSHCLGLADMYDTAYSGNYGMGSWDLMGSGGYNDNSFCPAGYTSYEKACCGWLMPIELTEDTTIDHMKPLSEGGEAYIIRNDNHPDEYYLLECRNQSKWDSALAGNGLLVTHVDYDPFVWRWNVVNANSNYYDLVFNVYNNEHPRCTLIAGDNALSSNNEESDPYPFNLRNYLSNVSSPAATLYNPNTDGSLLMNKAIRDIQRNDDGTVSFRFEATDTQSEPVFEGTLFAESFDNCDGAGGNDETWTGGNGSFKPDNSGWDYDKKNAVAGGAAKCARFGTRTTKGNVSLPKVFVGETSTLSFKAAPWSTESTRLSISILGSSTTTVTPTTFTLTPGEWTTCEATISGQGDITIRMTPSNNRFFLDDITIVAGNSPSDISSTTVQPTLANCRIYSIDGRIINASPLQLPHGVYIINKKKVVR